MRCFVLAVVCCAAPGAAMAQDRFVERAPVPRLEIPHTMERAGNPLSINRFAVPAVTNHDTGGYIGGQRLFGHRAFLNKGSYSTPGPVTTGTYGTDFAGFGIRPGRVFLSASNDPSKAPPIYKAYRTDGPPVTDVFAARPVRKAVLEAREDREERREGGHAPGGAGHAPAPGGSGH